MEADYILDTDTDFQILKDICFYCANLLLAFQNSPFWLKDTQQNPRLSERKCRITTREFACTEIESRCLSKEIPWSAKELQVHQNPSGKDGAR